MIPTMIRCRGCSYVFKNSELDEYGLCKKCDKEKEFRHHPVWQSLKLIRNSADYLLQCDPDDICQSKWADKIIEIGDSPIWKTIPKQ